MDFNVNDRIKPKDGTSIFHDAVVVGIAGDYLWVQEERSSGRPYTTHKDGWEHFRIQAGKFYRSDAYANSPILCIYTDDLDATITWRDALLEWHIDTIPHPEANDFESAKGWF